MENSDLKLHTNASNHSSWTEDDMIRLHTALLSIPEDKMRLPKTFLKPRLKLEEKKKSLS